MADTYEFRVNGVAKSLQPGWVIKESTNGRNTFDGRMLSLDGTFRLDPDDEIELAKTSIDPEAILFGGLVDQPSEAGFGGATSTDAIDLRVSAVDYNVLADRREVVIEIPAGTVKAALIALEPYYDDYGVTLDAGQADGPMLPAMSFTGERLREVLDQMSALTEHEWPWQISYEKVIGMYEIAATAAPFDVEDVDAEDFVDGDITVEQPTSVNEFNYIRVLAGTGQKEVTDPFTGDGSTTNFPLTYTLASHRGYVTNAGVDEPIGVTTPPYWTYDPVTNSITRSSAPANLNAISITYTGQFPYEAIADGGAAPGDRRDKTYLAETVFDATVAQALADAYLARDNRRPRTVRYGTYQILHPGMSQTIDIDKRNLTGTWTITEVELRHVGGERVKSFITAVEGSILPASIGETVMSWGGAGGGSSAAAVVTVVSSGGVGGTATAGQYAVWATSTTLGGVTSIPETAIADGALLARVAATETISASWTFTATPFISAAEPALAFRETDQGSNLKLWRYDINGGVMQLQTLDDAGSSVLATIWTISRAGNVAILGSLTAGSGAVGIIDSTGKIPAISSTYFASLSGVNLTGVDLLGAVNSHTVAGTHTWSAASATLNRLKLENTTSGATANASLQVLAGTGGIFVFAYSQAYTPTSTFEAANGGAVMVTTAGGLSLAASDAAGDVRIYSRNVLAATFGASQAALFAGAVTVTGAGVFSSTLTARGAFVVNLNTASLQAPPTATIAHFGQADGSAARIVVDAYGSTAGGIFQGRQAAGTAASPTATQTDSVLAQLIGFGRGATGYSANARGRALLAAAEPWSDSAQGCYWAFTTTANGAATVNGTERMRIDHDGEVGIGTSSPSYLLHVNGTFGAVGNASFTANVLPVTNYTSNIGAFTTKFLSLYAAELWVETLVAQSTMATIGGRILVAPTNILTADLAAAGTTITLKYNNFANGDRVYMEANGQVEWMAIASGAGGSAGAYTYTVTRNLDGSGANNWVAGDAVLNTGTTGNGFIDLFSTAGVLSGVGPTIVFNVRTGTTYNNIATRVAVGNLDGQYGISGSLYGFAAGDASAANIVIDATNGIRIRSGTTNYAVLASSTLTLGAAGGNRLAWDGTTLTVVSERLTINASGVSLLADPTVFAGISAYNFGRDSLAVSAGDIYALYAIGTAGTQTMFLRNTIVPTTTTTNCGAEVAVTAKGWNGTTQLAAAEAVISVASGNAGGPVSTSRIDLSASTINLLAPVIATSTVRLSAMTATTFVAGDKYVVVDGSGNLHRSAIGPAS